MAAKGERARVVVLGEKLVAQRCLDTLHGRPDTQVAAVVVAENDWQADLGQWAKKRGVRVLRGNAKEHTAAIRELSPDFLFSIQYRYLVRPELLKIPRRGAINLHFGLLPRYGGCYPVAWAILNGEVRAGATLHYMSEGFDEGDIIAQEAVRVGKDTTARGLYDALTTAAASLFRRTYPALLRGTAPRVAQDPKKRLYYAKDSIDFAAGRWVDWTKDAPTVHRQIRAFSFEPFQKPMSVLRWPGPVGEAQVAVEGARLATTTRRGDAGEVLSATPAGDLKVATGRSGAVFVAKIDGKPAAQFLKGRTARFGEARFTR